MLREQVQEFLDACGYQAKEETLKVLARLSEESSFSKAAEAVRAAVSHGASDVDSVLAIISRLSRDIMDLDRLALPVDVHEIPPVKLDLSNCDNQFLRAQSL